MSQYRLAARAEADLVAIWDYIAEESETAADRVVAGIVERFPTLARFPRMGRPREELAPALRSFVVGSYLIYYRPIDDGVEIVRIIHGARHLQIILDEGGFDNLEVQ